MKVLKNINNNVSICIDSTGKEVVAFGKGIGFKKPPYELELTEIERVYYDVDTNYISMINDIPESIIKVSNSITNYAREILDTPISSNVVFTLADHIEFCIKRYEKRMSIKLPILNDVEQLFEKEMSIGNYGLKLIKEQLHIFLPKEEAAYIALHILNAEERRNSKDQIDDDSVIEGITEIIEKDFNIVIDKNGTNYSRFVSHIHYLLKRSTTKELINSDNVKLYEKMVDSYPQANSSVETISDYLGKILGISLTNEEKLYLILHVNRLCVREDSLK